MKEKALTHLQKFIKKPCVNQALALLMCAATLFGTVTMSALAASNENGIVPGVIETAQPVHSPDTGTDLETTPTDALETQNENKTGSGVSEPDPPVHSPEAGAEPRIMLLAGAPAAPNESESVSGVSEPDPSVYTVDIATELAGVGLPAGLEITVTGEENASSVRTEPVEWLGDYNKDIAGEYILTAAFTDDTLAFSPMPTVRIIVSEAASEPQPMLSAAAPLGALQGTNGGVQPTSGGEDVNQGIVCTLTPKKSVYQTGEIIQFNLDTQFANPGTGTAPASIKFGIPLPTTTPALSLPMFNSSGTEAGYVGVPMCTLSFQGASTNLYLVTLGDGSRRIEYTIYPGDTIHGTLSMYLPNGVSEPVGAFTVTPQILTAGDFTTAQLSGGTTSVQAQFGWNDVVKTGSTDNLGVVGSATKNPDSITYTVTADSLSSGLSTGRVFTGNYVLTDTISMTGLHYADGALTQSGSGGVSSFFVGGVKVLEIAQPLSSLRVTKRASAGELDGFTVVYSLTNATLGGSAPAEIANLNLQIKLLLDGMALDGGNVDASLQNSAHFEAYSPFYDAGSGKTGADYYHSSTATHTALTTDLYELTKTAYTDAACTTPATAAIMDGATLYYKLTAGNDRANGGTFTIEDVLPNGLTYVATVSGGDGATFAQNGQTLTWSDIAIASGGEHTIIIQTLFSAAGITSATALHNVANLYTGGKIVATDSVDNVFVSGETQDAEIIYEKTASTPAPALDGNLTYTITVRNTNTAAPKLITVTDKWPGTAIIPTAVTGCDSFKLLDAAGTEYTLEQVAADPAIVIAQIKCYNVFVPAGGRTTLTITGRITQVLDELVNVVGEGSAGEARAKSYGVSIAKDAYKYDAATAAVSANKLTAQDEIIADDVVCYVMTVKNLKDSGIAAVELVDKLPAGLTLESVTYQGATGSVLLRRGNAFTNLGATGDTANVQTTGAFALASGETVRIYLFAKVSQAAITASESNGKKIVNAAYVRFGTVQTGDATANIYTMFDNTQKVSLAKTVELVADYNSDLTYAGTKMTTYDGKNYTPNVDENRSGMVVWDGAYVVYRVEIKNGNVPRVGIYELIDTLPAGMELVGVSKYGGRGYYNSGLDANNDPKSGTQPPDLAGKLYFDGESGPWISGSSKYGNDTQIGVTYDATARQVHVLFNGGDESNPLLLVSGLANNGQLNNIDKPFFYIVARVTDANSNSSFVNKAELRVNMSVHKPDSVTTNNETTDGNYNYISATAANRTLNMVPGITKKTVGHYTAPGPFIAGTDNISPGETLRFTVEIKNQDNSTGTGVNEKDANAGNLRDFTVVDYLPPEYTYRAGSASIGLNAKYLKASGELSTAALSTIAMEPTVTVLDDGRTKLTWSFTGKDTRLFNLYYYHATEGYMHVLTYDADWNANYPKVYGNYTNTADVIHSYDFRSVSTGSPNTAAKTIAASTVVNVYGTAGTMAEKTVTNVAGTTVSGQNTVNTVPITAGETVRYTMSVQNTATDATTYAKNLVVIDELPRAAGDTGVVNRVDRESEFAVLFNAAPNVAVLFKDASGAESPVDPGDYTVHYGTSVGGLNTNGDWSQAGTGGRIAWGADSDGKNAIRIAFADGFRIQKGEAIVLAFDAVSSAAAKPGETAWNSFGYSYRAVTGAETTAKIFAEPQRVGIRVPDATLSVTKTVTGDPAPANAEFTFVLKQNGTALEGARYTLSDSGSSLYTPADGSFKLKAGQTATFHVDPGSGFTVEEALTGMPAGFSFGSVAAAAAGDGTVAAQVFSYKAVAVGDAAGVVFTNSYAVPNTIDLTVEKQWLGAIEPNGYRPANVSVQLLANGVPEGQPVTLNIGNSWQHTWTGLDNRNTTWTVRETTVLPDGYAVQITGDKVNGFVITNTYSPSATTVANTDLIVYKEVAGDALTQAQAFTFTLALTTGDATGLVMPNPATLTTAPITTGRAPAVGFGDITFTKAGTYTFTITETASGIAGMDDADPQTVTVTVRDVGGRLEANLANSTPHFVNTYTRPTGRLIVSKTVTGGGNVNALFTFRFTFSEAGRYAYAGPGGATGTIATGESLQLKHGQSVTITIPHGVNYTVIEDAYASYIPTPADRTFMGTIGVTESRADYTNRYDDPYIPPTPTLTGNLTIQKIVTGDLGDRTKDFTFTVTFNASGSYYFTGSKTGMIASGDTILLRHGEYITIINLPAGTTYSVTESGNGGYRVYASGDVGIIAANHTSTAAFTNSRSKVPNTGDDGSLFKGLMLMLISLVGGAVLLLADQRVKRRRRRARTDK